MKQFHYFGTHLRIQVTGRFVGKDDLGITDNGTGNGNALALTAGKLCRKMTHAMTQTDLLKNLLCQFTTFGRSYMAIQQGKFHIIHYVK